MSMDLPLPDPVAVINHARPMAQRFTRAAWISLCFVALLAWIKLFEHWMGQPFSGLALRPHVVAGLIGVLTAPLLHGSLDHLASNALPLLILGTLAGGLYPRATVRALPLIWIGSGIGAWFLGEQGSAHIGASGIATGLLFLVFVLAVLRRDRQAIAAGMMAFFLYGGMMVTIFPREANISWEMHMSGAICGLLAAIIWRKRDAALPRKRYSWEDEPEEEGFDDGASRHADVLTRELPRGVAEDGWIRSDSDSALGVEDGRDAGRESRPSAPAVQRHLH